MNVGISAWDLVALAWFICIWTGYVLYTRHGKAREKSLLAAMDRSRDEWAQSIIERDVRIVDSQVINGLVSKETFFASTTVLILAGLVALMGSLDEVNALADRIPFAQNTSAVLWELKVGVLAVIFVYAFFKFTWAIRQHSYSAILLMSIPLPGSGDEAVARTKALRMARLSSLGASHFNDGVRAYYFALAELSWFINPIAFVVATTWVVMVVYRREFHSRALALLMADSL